MTLIREDDSKLNKDYFSIAGINVAISGCSINDCDFLSSLEIYRTKKSQDYDIIFRFTVLSADFSSPPDFFIDPLYFHRTEDGLSYFMPDSSNAKVYAKASDSWDNIEIVSNSSTFDPATVNLITDIAFRTKLLGFSGFSLHASIVELNGSCVIFVGPSGIGKSTQAELWSQRFGATIINGDYGIIRQVENSFHVYGSPWSGTSPYKTNTEYPICAVILLKQGKTNELIKLDSSNIMQGFLPNCLLPYWHESSMAPALEIIDKFLQSVPVYQLMCRPDYEAVEMTHDILRI